MSTSSPRRWCGPAWTCRCSPPGAPRNDHVLGVPVHRVPVRRIRRFGDLDVQAAFGAQALAHLALPVLRGRVDVWHATSTADAAAAALLGRTGRVRTVFTDHGFPARRSRETRSDSRLFEQVVAGIDRYVCVSEAAAGYLRDDYGREASVVPPGVVLDAHRPGQRDRRPTVLYAGSLTESRKGVHLLLDAARLLRSTVPDLQVWLAGPGAAHRRPGPGDPVRTPGRRGPAGGLRAGLGHGAALDGRVVRHDRRGVAGQRDPCGGARRRRWTGGDRRPRHGGAVRS